MEFKETPSVAIPLINSAGDTPKEKLVSTVKLDPEFIDTLRSAEGIINHGVGENPGVPGVPVILDSGNRTEFASGAVRDMRAGKGRCDLMPLEVVARCYETFVDDEGGDGRTEAEIFYAIREFQKTHDTRHLINVLDMFDEFGDSWSNMFLEVSKHFEEGAKKYGESNWQKGIPAHCYIDSAVRHYLKWLRGDKDEPHARAMVWNLMCCIWEVDYGEEWRKSQLDIQH